MNNFYRVLSLAKDGNLHALNTQLRALEASSPELAAEISAIFTKPAYKEEYDRLHDLYHALAQAYDVISPQMPVDSCNWSSRLAEFQDEHGSVPSGTPG